MKTTLLSAVSLGDKHINPVPCQTAGHVFVWAGGELVRAVSYKKLWKMLKQLNVQMKLNGELKKLKKELEDMK